MTDISNELRQAVLESRRVGWAARLRHANSLLPHVELVRAVIDDISSEIDKNISNKTGVVQGPDLSCTLCGTTESLRWWKCCPSHTNPNDRDDVVCSSCAKEKHPGIDEPNIPLHTINDMLKSNDCNKCGHDRKFEDYLGFCSECKPGDPCYGR